MFLLLLRTHTHTHTHTYTLTHTHTLTYTHTHTHAHFNEGSGELKEETISRSSGKGIYKDARKAKWGDLFNAQMEKS